MLKTIRLSSVMFLIFFALLCSQQVTVAEQKQDQDQDDEIDGFVEEMFEKDKPAINSIIEQPTGKKEQPDKETKADDSEDDPLVADNKIGLNFGDFLQMLVALVFVVGLLYATLRFINKRSRSYKSVRLIENLGGTDLGANRSAQLVKVGNRILIVGVGENIQLLAEITDEAEAQQIIDDYNDKMDQLIQPNDIFTKLAGKWNKMKPEQKQTDEFQLMLNNELKEMSEERKTFYEQLEKKGTDER